MLRSILNDVFLGLQVVCGLPYIYICIRLRSLGARNMTGNKSEAGTDIARSSGLVSAANISYSPSILDLNTNQFSLRGMAGGFEEES